MAAMTVPLTRNAEQVGALLDSPEVARLIADLDATRWTGRPGYPVRAMVGLALVKSVYALPTWTRAVRLVADHAALRETLGATPSIDAAYRFTVKLRKHDEALATCLDRVLASLRETVPGMGSALAIDGSDLCVSSSDLAPLVVANSGPAVERSARSLAPGGGLAGA